MNAFGRLFRTTIFGESHGAGVGVIIDGVPAGIPLSETDFKDDIERRKGGLRKGTTPRKEPDVPLFQSGVFRGFTTGAPLSIFFENTNTRSEDYEKQAHIPRPGHADFVADQKFKGFQDYRGGGHFSARLTTGIVAAGVVAKKIMHLLPGKPAIRIRSEVIEVGGFSDIEEGLAHAIRIKDSVGGLLECRVDGLPIGWGAPFWDSLESVLAHAVFAIPAVKGIEFGAGFEAARMSGSAHNDALLDNSGTTATNHAGGIVGGLSNGNELVFRIAFKPTASTPQEQFTFSPETGKMESLSVKGRHDLCVALRAPVIVEAMTALVLADQALLAGAMDLRSVSRK